MSEIYNELTIKIGNEQSRQEYRSPSQVKCILASHPNAAISCGTWIGSATGEQILQNHHKLKELEELIA